MSSLCDRCFSPGHCCRNFQLSFTNWVGADPTKDPIFVMQGLPFVPVERVGEWLDEETGDLYEQWSWSCPRLLPNGRCGDYENRPQVCRDFEPASDGLCVHYRGAEAGPH